MRCVAGGERGEKKNEEAMGERAHVLLAILACQALPSGATRAVTTAVKRTRPGPRT